MYYNIIIICYYYKCVYAVDYSVHIMDYVVYTMDYTVYTKY